MGRRAGGRAGGIRGAGVPVRIGSPAASDVDQGEANLGISREARVNVWLQSCGYSSLVRGLGGSRLEAVVELLSSVVFFSNRDLRDDTGFWVRYISECLHQLCHYH